MDCARRRQVKPWLECAFASNQVLGVLPLQQSYQQSFVYPPRKSPLSIDEDHRHAICISRGKVRMVVDVDAFWRQTVLLKECAGIIAKVTSWPGQEQAIAGSRYVRQGAILRLNGLAPTPYRRNRFEQENWSCLNGYFTPANWIYP